MSEKLTVGELVYKISGDMDNLKTELKRADTEIKKLKDTMERQNTTSAKFRKGFDGAALAVKGFITGALVRGLYTLVQSGAQLDALTQSFTKLSSQVGLDSEEVLTSLRRLSGGTIANKDIILSANRAITLGVAESMDEFGVLMQTARIRAQDMGISTTQAFDNIVTGIGRGSPLILDNLGFIVSATEATESYAKQLGTTADKLTEAQKKEALKASIMRQGREEIERTGEVTATYADRLAQASSFVTNLKDNIGRALLPAMASLLDVTFKNGEGMEMTAAQVNNLGKTFYRVGQVLITVGKSLTIGFRVIVGAVQHFVLRTAEGIQKVLEIANRATEALGLSSETISSNLKLTNDFIADLQGKMGDNLTAIEGHADDLKTALSEALDPQEYTGLSDGQLAALMDKTADSTAALGGDAEETKEKVEDFTDKLVSLRNEAIKTQEALEKDLNGAFKDFGSSIKDNFSESVTSLAQIVVGAQDKIKELKEALKADDLDSAGRKDIKKQIKDQEEILKSRKDFEERQAERIGAIRTKLEEAGIDAVKSGLDNLLTVRTLEEQIEEDKRLASLDEFERFEEEQSRKLLLLTDGFITEATILQNKIQTQKDLEADVTAFLITEDEKRLENTESWAKATIGKYQQVSDSLRNLISTQSQVQDIRTNAINPVNTPSIPQSVAPTSSSTTNNKNTSINAPVTINGQGIQNLTATEISAILGFELNKFIR